LIVFGGGLTALLAALPAAGQSRDNSCKIYFADDRSTPTDVKALLAAQGDSTAKVCAPETENISYATISAVWKGARGACIFQQGPTRYLKLNEQAGSYSTFMASGRADCPKQGDPSYKSADGVSEGVFVALMNFTGRISSSRENFDSALANRDQSYEDARAGIVSSDPRTRLGLTAIRLQPPDAISHAGLHRTMPMFSSSPMKPDGAAGSSSSISCQADSRSSRRSLGSCTTALPGDRHCRAKK